MTAIDSSAGDSSANTPLTKLIAQLQSQVAQLRETLCKRDAQLEELRRQALQDPMTGLANRRAFWQALDQALAEYKRYGRVSAVLMIDVDDFKVINDRLGHNVGDRVLAHVASVLKTHTRESDTVARTGGDEFCVLLREVDAEQVIATARRLCRTLHAEPCCADDHEIRLSVSVGGCALSEVRTRNAALQLADQRMYRHKGRNRSAERPAVVPIGRMTRTQEEPPPAAPALVAAH